MGVQTHTLGQLDVAVYAFVSTSYPERAGDPGGHFVRAEAQRRAAEGHEVHVVCPGDDRVDGAVQVWGCGGGEAFGWPGALTRLRENPLRLASAGSFCAAAARRLRALPRVDAFLAHFVLPSALLPPVSDAELEVVGHGSDLRVVARLPRGARAALFDALLRRGASFRFSSGAGRRELARSLPTPLSIALMRRSVVALPSIDVAPVDVPSRDRRRSELFGDEDVVVAMCGRLVEEKRFHLALDAVEAVGAVALVIGDGPARASLERKAAEAGVRARFVGQRTRPDALLDLSCADVVVHPSIREGAPTVVREARALGVPVVCCACGDVGVWAEDDDELFVVPGDGLSQAVVTRLAKKIDKLCATRRPAAFRL